MTLSSHHITMAFAGSVQMLLLACFTSAVPTAGNYNHLVTAPQPLAVEIGTNFTASCMVVDTNEVSADDLYWNLSQVILPKEQYTKINRTTLNVTVPISGENREWLYCLSREVSPYVALNKGKFVHGILILKGYPPRQPVNLTCIALQDRTVISPTITCSWDTVGRQSKDVVTKYTLNIINFTAYNVSTEENSASVTLPIFPHFMEVQIWVKAHNNLGTVESERLKEEAGYFAKTDPPANVKVISEKTFPTSLLLNWSRPIKKQYINKLTYEIRFYKSGAHDWTYVPPGDIAEDIESFRLQKLQPHTVYVFQLRCKMDKEGFGYWSEWSTNATKRTPEDRPGSKPDLWKKVSKGDDVGKRRVQIFCKDPVFANGKITRFDIKVQEQKEKITIGSAEWESFPVNRSDSDSTHRTIMLLKEINLEDQKSLRVNVTAINSVGKSPPASLFIPDKTHELPSVEDLRVWPNNSQMWVEWKPPNSPAVTEYVVEWTSDEVMNWQRERRSTRRTIIKDDLQKFVCYNVSVSPIYYGWTGKSATVQAYLEQGAPLEGPVVRLNNKPERNMAELVWTEIPLSSRQGFITNYTIFYTSGHKIHITAVVVPPDVTTYKLTSLTGNTKYDVWVSASTIAGSKEGDHHSFTTPKYATGEIELIVVGVSLGFLFFVIMMMLLCIYKKDVIKRNFWPQIPNPGESTIGNWSPDYLLRAETPKENCLSGISVLDVDDGKSVFEEDKAVLPLKKDKYLSEEHSSGIGGSSCMSSPRQSVSDSDEGGDMVDTTASTVQYSSVMASSGYKGQTPSSQPPSQAVFSRSESTQPLLDSEENPDVLGQDGSRQCFFRNAAANQDSFNQQLEAEQPEELETLSFCPLDEDAEQTPADEQAVERPQPVPLSSYMPQLGGYRPQ